MTNQLTTFEPKSLVTFTDDKGATKTKRNSELLMIRPGENTPKQVLALLNRSGIKPIVVSFGGGNDGLSDELKAAMPGYFSGLYAGFAGSAISGGTGHFDANRALTSFEITSVPALLAAENPCNAAAFTPLTTVPRLDWTHGAIHSDDWGGQIDPRHHANVIVANHPSEAALGWNGDLKKRFQLFEELLELDYTVAIHIFNGGNVTTEEIYMALELTRKGGLLFLTEGSQRECDKAIRALAGDVENTNAKGQPIDEAVAEARAAIREAANRSNVFVVKNNDVEAGRSILTAKGIVA